METTLGPIEAIPEGEGRSFVVGQRRLAVFRSRRGEVFATQAECPHKGGPLSQGIVHNKRVTCPLHNFVIELKSGMAVAPDEGCTRAHPVKVENGVVWLGVQAAATVPAE